MSSFTSAWLALREPADALARWHDAAVGAARLPALAGRAKIIDLGSGSGANLRYLAPRLGCAHDWILVDQDPALLRQALARAAALPYVHSVAPLTLDLAADLDSLPLADASLVTASAVLDLVSEDWLEALVGRCRSHALPMLFALTYDGMIHCEPAHADDAYVRGAVNAHQRRDKGFGPALGPIAAGRAESVLQRHGYRVLAAASPWRLRPEDAELQRALIDGWEGAAAEEQPSSVGRIGAWAQSRRSWLQAGRSSVSVGHTDLLAIPQVAD